MLAIARHDAFTPLHYVDVVFVTDLLLHAHRTDIQIPRTFDAKEQPDRRALVDIEVFAAFQYLLPKLRALSADDILELRQKVRNTREGFSMHLQKLSKDLDAMVKSGESLDALKHHAQALVETDLIPDYKEFRRQIESVHAGTLHRVLDAAGKITQIDAAPWTPKFWAALLQALGMTMLVTAEEQKERLSNRYQAFEFMRTVDELAQRKNP